MATKKAKPRREPRDISELAFSIVEELTADEPTENATTQESSFARAGQVGGKARAANLSKRRLRAIGKKGAAARWAKKSKST